MARPIKNNADYFPHDADMRNDTRIKALRRKHGLEGYAIYVMMVEFLTDSDFFECKNDSFSLELVAGDFDIETDKLDSILQYCFQLDLFQLDAETNVIKCKSLENRLNPLLSKRKRDRNVVIDSENTQSKVKESKVNKSIVEESKEKTLDWFKNQIDDIYYENLKMTHPGKDIDQAIKEAYNHVASDSLRLQNLDGAGAKRLLNTWLTNSKTVKKQESTGDFLKRALG